ncbi:MAG: tRNA lysidine(34) synthetase TilS [Prolixibacteraceae bacterium]|nr:tRNA lysidine(34) synthetase TilS [Prolixibacteraceae bacterium]
MLSEFKEFVKQNELFGSSDKILLAISGGVDSMVLFDLFKKLKLNFAAVHCNFKLRDEESDGDEMFVKQYVQDAGVQLFVKSFDTLDYAKVNGISVEMAARELRYNYFEKLSTEHEFDYIATAHHQDDLIETFFLNLIRKTGIKGLTGIKPKSGKLIRPLLFAGREMILKYVVDENIPYREDSSNSSIVHKRNFLRHSILPLFENLNPSFRNNIAESIQNLKEAEEVYQNSIEKEKKGIIRLENNNPVVQIEELIKSSFPKILLFEILSDYNFNSAVISEIFQGISEESGKQYFSSSHRVVRDRGKLIITENRDKSEAVFYIEEGDMELFSPVNIEISLFDALNFKIPHLNKYACFDYKKLEFPLIIKKWHQGEYFKPLGMDGFKKVSDFFIDEKFSIPEKENTWILYSGNKIAWIIGYRLDDRFKITRETKRIYQLKLL